LVWYSDEGNRTHLNATVRGTVARSRHDGIDTLINAIPLGSTNKKTTPKGVVFLVWYGIQMRGIEPI